jgi:mannosyltransferase OCH1-like enzyme
VVAFCCSDYTLQTLANPLLQFWTDASAYDFILENYPWFLETYESYPYNIQRVDAFRYFILLHYGGIYLDLDISTIRRLDPLLQYSAWSCRTYPTGISNDALGAAPNHPFYKRVTENLASYNKNWLLPYVTVMYTTGPLFLSVMWEEYIQSRHGEEKAMHSIFPDAEHFGNSYGFFNMTDGGTWHGKDLEVIMWMGDHWLLVTIGGILAGVTVVGLLAWVINRLTGSRPGNGYLRLEREMHIA